MVRVPGRSRAAGVARAEPPQSQASVATAIAATPSWRPMNPIPSPVVALRFTRSGPTRSAPASESRIDSR